MASAAADAGLRFVPEAFADRRYLADGSLQPRSESGSVLTDAEVAAAFAGDNDSFQFYLSSNRIYAPGDPEIAVEQATGEEAAAAAAAG